jgi:hypothetical protein
VPPDLYSAIDDYIKPIPACRSPRQRKLGALALGVQAFLASLIVRSFTSLAIIALPRAAIW